MLFERVNFCKFFKKIAKIIITIDLCEKQYVFTTVTY